MIDIMKCNKCHKKVTISRQKYCSKRCYNLSRQKRITKECLQCRKKFWKWPSRIKKYPLHFCSRKCFFYWRHGENHPAWKNGIKIQGDYIMVKKPNHPNARSSGYILQHRYVMSCHLKRPLRNNEIVHHINKKTKDNRIKNLQIMSWGEHAIHHHLGIKH